MITEKKFYEVKAEVVAFFETIGFERTSKFTADLLAHPDVKRAFPFLANALMSVSKKHLTSPEMAKVMEIIARATRL